MKRLFAVGLLLATILVACSTEAGADTRSIEVTMTDDLRYAPDALTVRAGETVRFVVHNAGAVVHEFLIGTEEEQLAFEEEMAAGHGGEHDGDAGVTVEPGNTEEFTYSFESAGQLLIGCHEPGHWEGGMRADLVVES